MTGDGTIPGGWAIVSEGAAPMDDSPPAGYYVSLPAVERADEVARHHVGREIGDAWIFPPVVVDGAVTYLFGRHDIDVDGDRQVRLSEPLGTVRVDGEIATIEWRWAPAPDVATEDDAPPAAHLPDSDALRARPTFEQVALMAELYRRATSTAIAAGGAAIDGRDTHRLADLFSFVTPEWLIPFYVEIDAGYLASIGWDPSVASTGIPRATTTDVPQVVAGVLGPLEAGVLTTAGALRGSLDAARVAPRRGSPLGELPAGDDADAGSLTDVEPALRALAAPQWLLHVGGLAESGFLDFSVAVADVDDDMIWTGLSGVDGSYVVSPDADPEAIAGVIEQALEATGFGPQGPVVMPLAAAHMVLAAALADEFSLIGDEAFAAGTERLQALIDQPASDGVVAAVTSLAHPPPIRLADGFGLPDYLTIDDGRAHARPMVQKFVRWLARPRAALTVTLTEFDPPDSDEPLTTGYSFVRTDDGLFVFAVTKPWGLDGVEADRRIDVAAIGTDVVRQMVMGLLGVSEPRPSD